MTKRETMETMSDVANRAIRHLANQGIRQDKLTTIMDLEYVNEICPLDFDILLAFDDGNFGHDINGIYKHFDRQTKTLNDCFSPRCSKPETVTCSKCGDDVSVDDVIVTSDTIVLGGKFCPECAK